MGRIYGQREGPQCSQMRLLLLVVALVCVAPVAGVRDEAFWRALVKSLSKTAKKFIVDGIAKEMNNFIQRYELTNDRRISHFLGQCGVESAWFQTTTEYASGRAYNGRRDLGNTQPGDGPRFKGRGQIQLTGRANYKNVGGILKQDFTGNPDMVAKFPWALEVSGVYWRTRKCINARKKYMKGTRLNDLADQNNYRLVTLNINGGYTHHDKREAYTKKAYAALQADKQPGPQSATFGQNRLPTVPHEVDFEIVRVSAAYVGALQAAQLDNAPPNADLSVMPDVTKVRRHCFRRRGNVFYALYASRGRNPHCHDANGRPLPAPRSNPRRPLAYFLNDKAFYKVMWQ